MNTATKSMSPEPRLRLEASVGTLNNGRYNRPNPSPQLSWVLAMAMPKLLHQGVTPMHCRTIDTRKPATAMPALTGTRLIMSWEPADIHALVSGHAILALGPAGALNGKMTGSILRSCLVSGSL